MKKKQIDETTGVNGELLREAKLALQDDRPRSFERCVICGGEAATTSTENLCWVCRRLKISAWRDSDHQMGAQE